MKVIISTASKSKVWHRPRCPHSRQILPDNRLSLPKHEAKAAGYRPCRCCATLNGSIRAAGATLESHARRLHMELTLDGKTLHARTAEGFWKIFWVPDADGLMLLHRNRFDPALPTEKLTRGSFHRQSDVRITDSLVSILEYIEAHDRAQPILRDDYHKLPRRTRQEKRYYEAAERRSRRNEVRRVFSLFDQIEKEREQKAAAL